MFVSARVSILLQILYCHQNRIRYHVRAELRLASRQHICYHQQNVWFICHYIHHYSMYRCRSCHHCSIFYQYQRFCHSKNHLNSIHCYAWLIYHDHGAFHFPNFQRKSHQKSMSLYLFQSLNFSSSVHYKHHH